MVRLGAPGGSAFVWQRVVPPVPAHERRVSSEAERSPGWGVRIAIDHGAFEGLWGHCIDLDSSFGMVMGESGLQSLLEHVHRCCNMSSRTFPRRRCMAAFGRALAARGRVLAVAGGGAGPGSPAAPPAAVTAVRDGGDSRRASPRMVCAVVSAGGVACAAGGGDSAVWRPKLCLFGRDTQFDHAAALVGLATAPPTPPSAATQSRAVAREGGSGVVGGR